MKNGAVAILFLLAFTSQSQIVYLTDSTSKINVSGKFLIYNDSLNQISYEEFKSFDNSKLLLNNQVSINASKGAVWARLKIVNKSNKQFFLKTSNTALSYIDFYKTDAAGNISKVITGINLPFKSREIDNAFIVFDVSNAEEISFKVRVVDLSAAAIPFSIYDRASLDEEASSYNLLNGIYLGVLFLIMVLCIFNFIHLKERVYLSYFLFVLINLVIINLGNGNLNKYFFQENLALNNYPWAITMWASVFYNLFMMDFLQVKKYFKNVLYVHYGLILFTLVVIVANIFGVSLLLLATVIVLLNHILAVVLSILVYRKGYKPAVFFFLANVFVFIGSVTIFGLILNFIPSNFFTSNGLQIALMFEMVVFTLGLSNKTYLLKKENEEAWEYLKHTLEDNQKILINQKVTLERQVQDRTTEIEAQNEELLQQQEELNSLNESLNQQKIIIEEQNSMLKNSNALLEQKVDERTISLTQANQKLLKQNKLLEQYSYITSHNLRGPIARILGLNNVLDILEPTNPNNKEILGHLNQTTLALDAIVKDLSIVLNVNQEIEVIGEKVSFFSIVDNIKTSISTSDIEIITDFTQSDSIFTVKPYLHSIFYNIISNAVKYRSKNRHSFLKIYSVREAEKVKIYFEDNGIGMDLKSIGSRLFRAFERFHSEIDSEGKGIGLYMVNLQIENLGGTLEIESQIDKGTTFVITLPFSDQN